jgi:hypothetical protein
MKLTPWDSYKSTMDTIDKKMDSEFQSLYQELSASGMVASEIAE